MHKVVRRESNERKMPNDWLMKVPRIGVPLADKAEGKKRKGNKYKNTESCGHQGEKGV